MSQKPIIAVTFCGNREDKKSEHKLIQGSNIIKWKINMPYGNRVTECLTAL